jgi:hypothetical protein
MECEMDFCEAEATIFRPILGVMRHVCPDHAFLPKPERPTQARPAVPLTQEDPSDEEKYTRRNRKRHR